MTITRNVPPVLSSLAVLRAGRWPATAGRHVVRRRLAVALVAAAGSLYALAPASANAETKVTLTNDSDLTFTYKTRSVQRSNGGAWTGEPTRTVRWSKSPQPVGQITWPKGPVEFVTRYASSLNGREVWLRLEIYNTSNTDGLGWGGLGTSCVLEYARDEKKDKTVERVPGYTCDSELVGWPFVDPESADFTIRNGG